MDSGFIEEGRENMKEFDTGQKLLPEEVLWIMDEIMGREAAYMRGFALSQTILTSEHVLDLALSYTKGNKGGLPSSFTQYASATKSSAKSEYTDLCLRAFCLATLIQCRLYIDMVVEQQYYEEEDCNTQTYGLDVYYEPHLDSIMELVDNALSWVTDQNRPNRHEELDKGMWTAGQPLIDLLMNSVTSSYF